MPIGSSQWIAMMYAGKPGRVHLGLGSALKLTSNDDLCAIQQVSGLLSLSCKGNNVAFIIVPNSNSDKHI